MESDAVSLWFDRLKAVWLAKDIEAVRALLSDEFRYYENPFEEPLTRWEAVKKEWEAVKSQEIAGLDVAVLIAKDNEGVAMYTLALNNSAGAMEYSRGSYYVKLDEQERAVEFRQWWMNQ